jgi:hypothetical protein
VGRERGRHESERETEIEIEREEAMGASGREEEERRGDYGLLHLFVVTIIARSQHLSLMVE